MRVIVHTGKGGTGKTSISAATALHCAAAGRKTLVISTDTAHSLGDALGTEVGPEPVAISANLWAQEVDVRHTMDKYWGEIQKRLLAMLNRQELADIVAGEVTILPGLEEGAHLLWIHRYLQEREYELLIVDAAPTAETLRLLSLPDVTRWWFTRILPLARGASRVLGPVSRALGNDGLPDSEIFSQIQELFETLDRVRVLLTDPQLASLRLVVTPERMVVRETQRTWTYLNLYGYATDAILCNRVLPADVRDPWFAPARAAQHENLALIRESFGELPLLQAPLLAGEPGGPQALRELARALYGERDPAARLFDGQTQRIEATPGGGYTLIVPLPFARREDLDLFRDRDELTLRVGPWRRNFVLPHALRGLEIAGARFAEASLRIRFRGPRAPAPSSRET